MSTSAPSADRNLIFGLLALQMDFLTREQLLEAMHAWMLAKDQSLGQILCRRGVLNEDDRADLDRLVNKHIKRHGSSPSSSLAAIQVQPAVREELDRLNDADVQASLVSLAPTPTHTGALATFPTVRNFAAAERFRRLREHAKGGLGEVYVALDAELNREVALKEIQDHFADRADSRARFVREAEITGNLEHPGIVPVYGLGTYADGRPFYAMRLIRGESMKDAIERFHEADKRPGRDHRERSLALRDLLGRFVAVCNTIAYAHAQGAIHRDLKPANVMLGEYGETLVVDWGLSRLLNRPDGEQTTAERPFATGSGSATETEMGQVVGTPAYMSPEQAEGLLDRVGITSDVFSLGSTLYTLLTGHAPYHGDDLVKQARRAEVVPARQRKPSVAPALEAVCSKAMAKRPEDRYPTARALAADIEHWLADEPVSALREPWTARAGRWARRNRSLVTAAAAALVVAAVGAVLAVLLLSLVNMRERRLKLIAQEHEQEAKKERDNALKNFRLARDAVDEYCTKVGQDVRLKEHDLTGLRQQLLGTAVTFYQKFIDEHGNDPELRAELGRAYTRLAMMTLDLEEHDKAITQARQAVDIFKELVQADPDNPEFQHELASSYVDLGNCYGAVPNHQTAIEVEKQAVPLWTKLVKEHPEERKYAQGLARVNGNLGESVRLQRHYPEAERYIRAALDILTGLDKRFPQDEKILGSLASNARNLANTYRFSRKTQEGIASAQQAETWWADLARNYPKDPYYRKHEAITLHILALLYEDAHDFDRAGEAMNRAIAIHKDLVANYPGIGSYQDDLGGIYANQGMYLDRIGRTNEAIQVMRQAIDVREKLAARYPNAKLYQEGMAHTLSNFAFFCSKAGKEAEFADNLIRAIPYLEKTECKTPSTVQLHTILANNLTVLIQLRTRKGTPEQAVEACRLLVKVRERLAARPKATLSDSYMLVAAYADLGLALSRARKYEDALRWAEKSLAVLGGLPAGNERQNQVIRLVNLQAMQRQADALRMLKRHTEALAVWDRLLQLTQPNEQPYYKFQRALAVAASGDHKTAASEVQEIAARPKLQGTTLYDLACLFALCSSAARKDISLPESERAKSSEAYAVRAVETLKRAQMARFFANPATVSHLDDDEDLDALRQRPEFKKLVVELKDAVKAKKAKE